MNLNYDKPRNLISFFAMSICVAIIILFILAPLASLLIISLSDSRYFGIFPPEHFSFRWYLDFFSSKEWITALVNSLVIASTAGAIGTASGFLGAFPLARRQFRFKKIIIVLIIMPVAVPLIVLGVGLYFFYAKLGLIDTYLGLILAHSLLGMPLVLLNTYSALRTFESGYEQVACSLGCSNAETFLRVIIPMLRSQILASYAMAFLMSFDEIVIAIYITGESIVTLPKQMWDNMRFEINPTVAVAGIVVLSIAIALALGVISRADHKIMRDI